MKKSDLDSYNIKYCDKDSLNKMCIKYSNKNKFRYLWSDLKNQYSKRIIKIKASNIFYKEVEKYCKNYKIYLFIDRCCIEDCNEDLAIIASSNTVLKILIDNYWDLDEICISSLSYEWVIWINHNFEVFFVGDKIIDFYEYIIKIDKIRDSIILFE